MQEPADLAHSSRSFRSCYGKEVYVMLTISIIVYGLATMLRSTCMQDEPSQSQKPILQSPLWHSRNWRCSLHGLDQQVLDARREDAQKAGELSMCSAPLLHCHEPGCSDCR